MPKPAQNAFNNIQFLILITVLMLTVVGAYMYYNSSYTFPGTGGTVTVTGSSQSFERNRIASFNATVNATNADKELAVTEMNNRVLDLMNSLNQYGIEPKDLKTTNVSVYREQYWDQEESVPVLRDWRASTTVEIRLIRAEQAGEVSELLASLDVSEIFGPNFRTDGALNNDSRLLTMALADARSKAESVASVSGKRIGKMIEFVEAGSAPQTGTYYMKEGLGGADMAMEPGTTETVKYVTVTYILK